MIFISMQVVLLSILIFGVKNHYPINLIIESKRSQLTCWKFKYTS